MIETGICMIGAYLLGVLMGWFLAWDREYWKKESMKEREDEAPD